MTQKKSNSPDIYESPIKEIKVPLHWAITTIVGAIIVGGVTAAFGFLSAVSNSVSITTANAQSIQNLEQSTVKQDVYNTDISNLKSNQVAITQSITDLRKEESINYKSLYNLILERGK